jgi:hypothetical protein
MNDCRLATTKNVDTWRTRIAPLIDYSPQNHRSNGALPPDQRAVLLAVRTRLRSPSYTVAPFLERRSSVDVEASDEVSFGRGDVSDRLANFLPSSN